MDKLIARTTVSANLFSENAFPVRMSTLRISEAPLSGIIRLQGRSEEPAFRAGVEAALGVEPPHPERVIEARDVNVAWSGPNEFLCFCELASEDQVKERLTQALTGVFATVTLVSDSRAVFVVEGDDAANLISKGCAIDTDSKSFDVGHVVTTRFAGLPAMLLHRAEAKYVLYIDVGYTEFFVKWLLEAAEEFDSSTL